MAWTLRSFSAADGKVHDYWEATRFKRRRAVDVTNLQPGVYDLFVGVRRNDFFFEEPWTFGTSLASPGKNASPGKPLSKDELSLNLVSPDSSIELEEDELRVVRQARNTVGTAMAGLRLGLSAVTLGQVGKLGLDFSGFVVDSDGSLVHSFSEVLLCCDKANFELRLTLQQGDTLQLSFKSLSTVHSVYIFASLFHLGDETLRAPNRRLLASRRSRSEDSTSYDRPFQMLTRAFFLASRHPERSRVSRALALSTLWTMGGLCAGFFMEPSHVLPISLLVLGVWIIRVLMQSTVFFFDL